MRILLALLAACVLSLALGCQDESARQSAEAQAAFDSALAIFQEAEAGFIPESSLQGKKLMDIKQVAFRQQKLAEAAEALKPVIDQGSALQQAAAMRLVAAVHQSSASFQARQAVGQWAEISQSGVNLLNLLLAVDTADSQVRRSSGDSSALLNTLKNDQAKKQGELTQFQQAAGDLKKKIDEFEKQRSDLQAKAQAAEQESRKLRTSAFTMKGDEQYATYDKATEADRRAGVASSEAQMLAEKIDVVRSEMLVIEAQAKLAQDALASLQRSIQQTADREASTRKAYEAAVQDKETNSQSLSDALGEASKRYAENVRVPMIAATDKAQEALNVMKQATEKAPASANRRDFQLDLLSKHAALAHVLTSHVVVSSDWSQLLDVIATTASQKRGQEALMAARASGFQTNALEVQGKQRELVGQAKQVINDGLTLAAELTSSAAEGDSIAASANQLADRLQAYSARLDKL